MALAGLLVSVVLTGTGCLPVTGLDEPVDLALVLGFGPALEEAEGSGRALLVDGAAGGLGVGIWEIGAKDYADWVAGEKATVLGEIEVILPRVEGILAGGEAGSATGAVAGGDLGVLLSRAALAGDEGGDPDGARRMLGASFGVSSLRGGEASGPADLGRAWRERRAAFEASGLLLLTGGGWGSWVLEQVRGSGDMERELARGLRLYWERELGPALASGGVEEVMGAFGGSSESAAELARGVAGNTSGFDRLKTAREAGTLVSGVLGQRASALVTWENRRAELVAALALKEDGTRGELFGEWARKAENAVGVWAVYGEENVAVKLAREVEALERERRLLIGAAGVLAYQEGRRAWPANWEDVVAAGVLTRGETRGMTLDLEKGEVVLERGLGRARFR